ncbi:hypothetical protein AAC387_Pa02g2123 [Persea americana]
MHHEVLYSLSSPAHAPATVAPSTISATPAVPVSTQAVAPQTCNWTEHTSPEGYKYYYNGATTESRWEKPDELTLFEQQQQKQKLQPLPPQIQLRQPSLASPYQASGGIQSIQINPKTMVIALDH